jgi:hypothetical protein
VLAGLVAAEAAAQDEEAASQIQNLFNTERMSDAAQVRLICGCIIDVYAVHVMVQMKYDKMNLFCRCL